MAVANYTWGEERIAAELLLKLGIRVSPRTIRQYLQRGGAPRAGARSQTWSTFVRNHARSVLACDFFATVTATFRVFHVFVVLEVGTRRIPAGFITSTDSNWRREAVRGTERNTCGAQVYYFAVQIGGKGYGPAFSERIPNQPGHPHRAWDSRAFTGKKKPVYLGRIQRCLR